MIKSIVILIFLTIPCFSASTYIFSEYENTRLVCKKLSVIICKTPFFQLDNAQIDSTYEDGNNDTLVYSLIMSLFCKTIESSGYVESCFFESSISKAQLDYKKYSYYSDLIGYYYFPKRDSLKCFENINADYIMLIKNLRVYNEDNFNAPVGDLITISLDYLLWDNRQSMPVFKKQLNVSDAFIKLKKDDVLDALKKLSTEIFRETPLANNK